MDLFKELIPAILQTKKNVLENEKEYEAFVVNKALSFHYDCILYANAMNQNSHLDNKLQFDFLLNSVRGYKRPFRQWQKLVRDDDLEVVKEYFNYSTEKAKSALQVLSKDQLKIIREELDVGGNDSKPKRHIQRKRN